MTTETTQPALQLAQTEFPETRDALMHALAVAEEAVSALAIVMPTDVALSRDGDRYDVSLYFPNEPTRVIEFATAWQAVADRAPHQTRKASYTEVTVTIRGVRVRAWTITEDDDTPAGGDTA